MTPTTPTRAHRLATCFALSLLAGGCTGTITPGWDPAVGAGPPAAAGLLYIDVRSTDPDELSGDPAALDGPRFLTTSGVEDDDAVAQFALLREAAPGTRPLLRMPGGPGCGDRLVVDDSDTGVLAALSGGAAAGTELLGHVSLAAAEGTEELVELLPPADGTRGCALRYETDADEIAELVAEGFRPGASLGFVYPPGWGTPDPDLDPDPEAIDERSDQGPSQGSASSALSSPAPCHFTGQRPLVLFYASPGADRSLDLLRGCPGEVVIGEKRSTGPTSRFKRDDAHAAGGRTAYVMDNHGLDLLARLRDDGVDGTVEYMQRLLDKGYDYIVIDEVTTDPRWADSALESQRLRSVLARLPRKIIAYISIDLTQYAGGDVAMRARKKLLGALKRYGRAMALEVYLHTGQVTAGQAPAVFRIAANRLGRTVKGGNRRAITVLGTTVRSKEAYTQYPQYQYLDAPHSDLRAIKMQVNAIRHGSRRLRSQRGLGFYFVNTADISPDPGSPYDTDQLVARLQHQSRRFRLTR